MTNARERDALVTEFLTSFDEPQLHALIELLSPNQAEVMGRLLTAYADFTRRDDEY